ncbi:MAG: acyltransferase [Polyangiaceae bacterium]
MAKAPLKIPCLDGLRAVSILLVVLSHAAGTAGFPYKGHGNWMGHFGVRVFFIISGYLITRLLLEEHAERGSISLLKFYFRRTFRIFPPFYVLVGIVAVLAFAGVAHLHSGDLFHAMTYTMNYHPDPGRGWELGHLWSLAVEEQFYLLWPAVVLLLKPRHAWIAAAIALVACPIVRFATFRWFPASASTVDESFQTVADTLATGCLLALVRARLDAVAWFVRIQSFAVTPLVHFGLAIAVFQLQDHVTFSSLVGESIVNVLLGLTIDACLRTPHSVIGRFLEWRPIAFIGVLSYSIYLVQQVLLLHDATAWYARFPQNLGFTAIAAVLMHYLIEKPALARRVRLQGMLFPSRAAEPPART